MAAPSSIFCANGVSNSPANYCCKATVSSAPPKRWDSFETQLAYTDLNARDDATGIRLPYVAEQQASWWNRLLRRQ